VEGASGLAPKSARMNRLRIATWNVNGIRARQQQFLDWVNEERPDVVCLQEIKASPEQVPAALCEMGDMAAYWCYWHGGGKGYSGVGLHVAREAVPERPAFEHPDFDYEYRIATVRLHRNIVVASVYVPNGGKDFPAKMRFLEALEAWVGASLAAGDQLVVCGDLNVAHREIDLHPKERKPTVIGQLPEERALFDRILGLGMVDVARALHPEDDGMFSWWAPWRNMRQRNIGWRIDYVLASAALAEQAVSCGVQAAVGTSDHAPVAVEFALKPAPVEADPIAR